MTENPHPSLMLDRNEAAAKLARFSTTFQTVTGAVYGLTAALSIIGNLIVMSVMLCGRKSSKELRRFLLTLALSDILMGCINIPLTHTEVTMGYWRYADGLCPAMRFVETTAVT